VVSSAKSLEEINKDSPLSVKNLDGSISVFCPICRAPMILRSGPYGKFWGCSRFRESKCPGKRNEYFI
jgi:ssDNA-binding Zn-finger/Zn-ribbon topoisomerase 1